MYCSSLNWLRCERTSLTGIILLDDSTRITLPSVASKKSVDVQYMSSSASFLCLPLLPHVAEQPFDEVRPAPSSVPAPVEDDIVVSLQKQRRLLLLYHASLCPHDDSLAAKCRDVPHCSAMKRLYHHVIACHDHHCKLPGCKKHRSVWNHYQACRDETCIVCSPVHNTAHG
jgi:hypothetical protein